MKESGRPFPEFSPDEVVDYMVAEAVVLKAQEARKEEEKKREREEFRKSHRNMTRGKG